MGERNNDHHAQSTQGDPAAPLDIEASSVPAEVVAHTGAGTASDYGNDEDEGPIVPYSGFGTNVERAQLKEEHIWNRIIDLRAAELTPASRLELHEKYIGLASFYYHRGSPELALKMLLAGRDLVDVDEYDRWIARVQAELRGLDFINSFEQVIKTSNSKAERFPLLIEYCYFLEHRHMHEAAVAKLTNYCKARREVDPDDGVKFREFIQLLEYQHMGLQSGNIDDYRLLYKTYVDAGEVKGLILGPAGVSKAAAGVALTETREEHGFGSELKQLSIIISFGFKYYFFETFLVIACSLLSLAPISNVPENIVQIAGNVAFAIVLAALCTNFFGALASDRDLRGRKLRRCVGQAFFAAIAINAVFVFSVHVGYKLIDPVAAIIYFSLLVLLVTVAGINYTISLLSKARQFPTWMAERLTRRLHSQQVAGFVCGSAIWTGAVLLILRIPWLYGPELSVLIKLALLVKLLFCGFAFWWGILEMKADKKLLRQQIMGVLCLLFTFSIVVLRSQDFTWRAVAHEVSFPGILLGMVFTCAALWVTSLNLLSLIILTGSIIFVNGIAILDRFGLLSPIFLSEEKKETISLSILGIDLILCVIVFAIMVHLFMKASELYAGSWQSREKQEVPMRKPDKNFPISQAVFVIGVGVMFMSMLGLLLGMSNNLSSIALFLILSCFTLFVGFMLPFVLRFFGMIEEATWERTFSAVLRRAPRVEMTEAVSRKWVDHAGEGIPTSVKADKRSRPRKPKP